MWWDFSTAMWWQGKNSGLRAQITEYPCMQAVNYVAVAFLLCLFCSITLQGTSFFLVFNLPRGNPWLLPVAIMPVANTGFGSAISMALPCLLSCCTRQLLDPPSLFRLDKCPCAKDISEPKECLPLLLMSRHALPWRRKGSTGRVSRDILHDGQSWVAAVPQLLFPPTTEFQSPNMSQHNTILFWGVVWTLLSKNHFFQVLAF